MARRADVQGRKRGGVGGWIIPLIIILVIVANSHATAALIPIAAIAALTVLLWQPVHAFASRLERGAAPADPALEQRVRALESQIDALMKQQMQLQETLHWQERLLDRTTEERHASPASIAGRGR